MDFLSFTDGIEVDYDLFYAHAQCAVCLEQHADLRD